MKKYLPGLSAIVIAIGMSAFTSVKENSIWVFYQLSEGSYTLTRGSATTCSSSSSNPCKITYTEDPGVLQFVIEERPEGGTDSPQDKLFE